MAKEIKLSVAKRALRGSSAANVLRRQGWLPGVVYGEGRSCPIQVNTHRFELLLGQHAGDNLLIDLEIEGEGVRKVLLKEVQHGPVRGELLHADFLEVSMTRKMRVTIPIEFVGEPVGVSQQSGVLEHALRELEVECLPGDLVEKISVEVSALNIGDSLLVRDLKVAATLTVLTAPDVAVASVTAQRMEEEKPAEEAAEAVAGEPEVIGKKKEEEGESAAGEGKSEKKAEKAEKPEKKADKPEKKGKE